MKACDSDHYEPVVLCVETNTLNVATAQKCKCFSAAGCLEMRVCEAAFEAES